MPCLPFRACLFAPAFSRLPFRACLFALILLSVRICAADPAPPPVSWDANAQGQFITSLCRDTGHNLWIGTEDQGLWRFDPNAPAGKQYSHFTTKDGLGDDNAYSLTCDNAGRLWAGTLNHGVSVYNGKTWRTYGPLDGPLGSRVFALAVNPKDGGVWGATEAGLFRYLNARWTYFTRADGLPSDQASALAFDADGTLYVGTQCDGIAIASPADGYHSWRIVPGPPQMPRAATGDGLPSALINCLLVTQSGTVYAGTPLGLAASRDAGRTWRFRRGVDWKDKLAGLLHPVTPDLRPVLGDLLAEDYVTCLGEDGGGRLFVGHRQGGVEVFDPRTGVRVQSGVDTVRADDYVGALRVEKTAAWVGLYGGGLMTPPGESVSEAVSASDVVPAVPASLPPLPMPARAPTLAELRPMLARVKSLTGEMPVGSAAYLGEDWQTQGDWVGRYGRKFAVLCAARAPLNHDIQIEFPYKAQGQMGPHHDVDDGIRNWCTWVKTDNPKSLYDPIPGYRRQAEWDDHGESYPNSFAGPDIWISINVPEGVQRVSLYFMNKDGHEGSNRNRDYSIEIKPFQPSLEVADVMPSLAQARVRDFWGGVYKSFVIRGPSKYWIKIAKNNSLNTIVSAVLIDKLKGPTTKQESWALGWMGGVHYGPPDPDAPVMPDPHLLDKLLAAKTSGAKVPAIINLQIYSNQQKESNTGLGKLLWSALNEAYDEQESTPLQGLYRLLIYRSAIEMNAAEALQTNWRWQLHLWGRNDRNEFDQVMALAHSQLLRLNPQMQGLEY